MFFFSNNPIDYKYLLLDRGFGDRDDPEVTILQGTVKGAKLEKDGERVDRFLSIPYGKPPVGDLRCELKYIDILTSHFKLQCILISY